MNLLAMARRSPFDVSFLRRPPSWGYWVVFAAVAGPIGVVAHELGHFFAAHLFGFPDVVLHFGSVEQGGTEAGAPGWQLALQAGAGPIVTLALLGVCCAATAKFGAQPWSVAPGFAIGIRSALVGFAYLLARVRGFADTANFDELNFARALDLSMDGVMAVSTVLVLACWAFLTSRIPSQDRLKALLAGGIGTAVGLVLYVNWLGPWILP